MTQPKPIWFLACLLAVAACALPIDTTDTAEEVELGQVSEPLFLTDDKWPDGVVPLCFECGTGPTAEQCSSRRTMVNAMILDSFGVYTNLVFVDEGTCDDAEGSNPGMMRIRLTTDPGSFGLTYQAYLDESGETQREARGGYDEDREVVVVVDPFFSTTADTVWIQQAVARALGFGHEFLRDDEPVAACSLDFVDAPGTELTSYYDVDSIMNYGTCQSHNQQLSAGDIAGLQKAYGRKASARVVGPYNECLQWDSSGEVSSVGCTPSLPRADWVQFNSAGQLKTSEGTVLSVQSEELRVMPPPTTDSQKSRAKFSWRSLKLVSLGDLCIGTEDFWPEEGDLVKLGSCWSAVAPMTWTMIWPSSSTVRFNFRDDQCLRVRGGVARDGARLEIGDCDAASVFKLGWGQQELRFGTMCVDILNDRPKLGAGLQVRPCSGKPDQNWHLQGSIESAYEPGTCVATNGRRDPCGTSEQLWRFYP